MSRRTAASKPDPDSLAALREEVKGQLERIEQGYRLTLPTQYLPQYEVLGLWLLCSYQLYHGFMSSSGAGSGRRTPTTQAVHNHLAQLADRAADFSGGPRVDREAVAPLRAILTARGKYRLGSYTPDAHAVEAVDPLGSPPRLVFWVLDDANTRPGDEPAALMPYLLQAWRYLQELSPEERREVNLVLLSHHAVPAAFSDPRWPAVGEYREVRVLALRRFLQETLEPGPLLAQVRHWHRNDTRPVMVPARVCSADGTAEGESVADGYERLRRDALEGSARHINLVAGFGRGKTFMTQRLVLGLCEEAEKSDPPRFVLPLWVSAHELQEVDEGGTPRTGRAQIEALLWQAFRENVGLAWSPDEMRQALPWLFRLGRVVLCLDALDESPVLLRIATRFSIDGRAGAVRRFLDEFHRQYPDIVLIVSCRPEFYGTEQEMHQAHRGGPWETIRLGRAERQEVLVALNAQAPEFAVRIQEHLAVLGELLERPVFLPIFRDMEPERRRALLRDWPADTDGAIVEVLEHYVAQWARYEDAKSRGFSIEGGGAGRPDRDRRRWAELLAVWECVTRERAPRPTGDELAHHLDLLLEYLLADPALDRQQRGACEELRKQLPEFLDAVRICMFLRRDAAEGDRFEFAHASLRDYLCARVLHAEVEAAVSAAQGGNPIQPVYLGLFPLEQHGLVVRILCTHLLRRDRDWDGVQATLSRLLQAVASGAGGCDAWGPRHYLRDNLVVLLLHAQQRGGKPANLDLRSLDLSLTWLEVREPSAATVRVDDADLEGAEPRPPSAFRIADAGGELLPLDEARRQAIGDDPPASLPGVPLTAMPERPERNLRNILAYCLKVGLTEEHDGRHVLRDVGPGPRRSVLGEFVVVPGGEYLVQPQCPTGPPEVLHALPDRGRGSVPEAGAVAVRLPSFLIQARPVTNRQFAYLVSNPGQADAPHLLAPEVWRRKINVRYYLKGWGNHLGRKYVETLIHCHWDVPTADRRFLDNPDGKSSDAWKRDEEERRSWLDAPVVFVDWTACDRFARAFGLRLPYEAEYEAALRWMQDRTNELDEATWFTEKGWEWEWHEDGGGMPPLYLENVAVGDGTTRRLDAYRSLQEKWAEGRQRFSRRVPLDLLGSVWHWTADRWSAFWPVGGVEDLQRQGAFVKPCLTALPPTRGRITGLSGDARGGWLAHWKEVVSAGSYAVRGGSFMVPGRDVTVWLREPMPWGAMHHDVGFRLVCEIRPPAGLEDARSIDGDQNGMSSSSGGSSSHSSAGGSSSRS